MRGDLRLTLMPLPRSIYSARLNEFGEFAFGDRAAFQHCGHWRDFFRRRIGPAFNGRIIVEIGCSDAAYLSHIAAKHPACGFVGVDWKCKPLYDGAQLVAERGLANVALLRARGQDVARIFAEREIAEVWVFHPDPCDRDVELKNRLIAEPFLRDVHKILHAGTSILSLKTDHPGYYQWVLALFGLPEPPAFQAARQASLANPLTRNPELPAAAPRIRARDFMRTQDLPNPSDSIRQQFAVTANSADYWHDAAALAHTAGRHFSGEKTMFESRFIKKRMPIYYFEMQKREAEG